MAGKRREPIWQPYRRASGAGLLQLYPHRRLRAWLSPFPAPAARMRRQRISFAQTEGCHMVLLVASCASRVRVKWSGTHEPSLGDLPVVVPQHLRQAHVRK